MVDRWALVVRLGGIGDNLIASSILPLLKNQGFKIAYMAQDPWQSIIMADPHIDRLIAKAAGEIPIPADQFQKWFWDRRGEYDRLINLSGSIEGTLMHVPNSSTFYWPDEILRKVSNVNYLERTHDIAGVPHIFQPRFYPTPSEDEQARRAIETLGGDVLGWCLSGSNFDKTHPFQQEAVMRVLSRFPGKIVFFGGKNERDRKLFQTIYDVVRFYHGDTKRLCLATEWPVRKTLAVAQHCRVIVGPDTGVMWAVAFNPRVRKVLMLSHASPENISKHWRLTETLVPIPEVAPCWPCHKLHSGVHTCRPNANNNGAACISSISPDLIAEAVIRQWSDPP